MGFMKKLRRYTKLEPTQPNGVADAGAVTAATVTLTQAAAPAGGVGATEGAYDTAVNRDAAITSINAARTDIAALNAEYAKLRTDVQGLRTKINAILTALEARGVIANA